MRSFFTPNDFDRAWQSDSDIAASHPFGRVKDGYLDRLPQAAVSIGMVDVAEIWSFAGSDRMESFDSGRIMLGNQGTAGSGADSGPIKRVFRAKPHAPPYSSDDALAYIRRHGAPEILCVWGLGIDESLLHACASSIKVYNSIDDPAIRIPVELSRHFDLFLTGAEWQSQEIRARHANALCAVLPIGPEFASDITFFPTGAPKDYDVVYVAATQPYKRHDLLLQALTLMPHLRALCIVGYGDMTDALRAQADARGLSVDWIGPLTHDEVNQWVNRARVGVVCGVHDGAPAILTEYMLAGLPVLANAGLRCGLQYIRPDTGIKAPEDGFAEALSDLVARSNSYKTRAVVQENWTWPHSIRRFEALLTEARLTRHERILA